MACLKILFITVYFTSKYLIPWHHMPPCLLTLEFIFYSKLNSKISYEERIAHPHSPLRTMPIVPKGSPVISLDQRFNNWSLDHYETKFSLVTIYLYYLTLALESQVFIPNNCFMPRKHDQNEWPGWSLQAFAWVAPAV